MTAEVLGVPYEFKKCDLMAGENMKVKDTADVYRLAMKLRENSFNLIGFLIFLITFILQPEYLAINPFHNIPALKDGDFCLNESRVAAKA